MFVELGPCFCLANMGREPRGQGRYGPENPGARDQAWDPKRARSGPGPAHAHFLNPRLGPWPLGSLAHMVLGPWVPGPYLQGRNMTFGGELCRLREQNASTTRNIFPITRQICRLHGKYVGYAEQMSVMRKICRLREKCVPGVTRSQ